MSTQEPRRLGPLVVAGIALGIGLGGFVDGILLHQVLQWHHMLTDHPDYATPTVHNLEVNTLWDGVFHGGTWVFTVLGVGYLWRAGRMESVGWCGRALLGGMTAGWGAFNLVEGVIDHHILGLHHVRDDLGGPLVWDLGFLAFGGLLVVAGAVLVRSAGQGSLEKARA